MIKSGICRLQVLGVEHTDSRLPDLVLSYVDEDVSIVCHEEPEGGLENIDRGQKLRLLAVRPTYLAVSIIIRFQIIVNGLLAKILPGDRSPSADSPMMYCKEAAERLADEHNTTVEQIGMDIDHRISIVPIHYTLLEWGTIALLFILLLNTWWNLESPTEALIWIGFSIILWMLISGFVYKLTLARVEDERDEWMTQNIKSIGERRETSHVVAIVGENHVEGIIKRARNLGIDSGGYKISSDADVSIQ